jgi:hypothetical protein
LTRANLLALFLAACLRAAEGNHGAARVPFTIEASEDVSRQFTGLAQLQSFAWATWQGKWVFIAGRTNGYHGLGGGDTDFDRPQANQRIWVVDPSTSPAGVFSTPVSVLPDRLAAVRDQWMSSNPLHFQAGDTLYIAGGYGKNSNGEYVTYPVLSSVNLPSLIDGVVKGKDMFSAGIAHVESPLVQSTGGELLKLDDGNFYLMMGHVFMGRYSEFEANGEKNTPKVWQSYVGEIRKLKVNRVKDSLSVTLIEQYKNPEFARRDFNGAFRILPDGKTLGAAVYGGVFTADQTSFSKPIYLSAKEAPVVDNGFDQKMSAYTCAKLLLFDPAGRVMYTTFFGGISRWLWNYTSQAFVQAPIVGDKSKSAYQDGMPWIDQISTLASGAKGTSEFVQPANRLPAYLGTNMAFLPVPGFKRVREEAPVFDLAQFRGKRTLVGYLFGGVRAFPKQFPYREDSTSYNSGNVPTKPSNMILKVYLTVPAE